jgi:hypothetical protein
MREGGIVMAIPVYLFVFAPFTMMGDGLVRLAPTRRFMGLLF